jgi:hypothetical protein
MGCIYIWHFARAANRRLLDKRPKQRRVQSHRPAAWASQESRWLPSGKKSHRWLERAVVFPSYSTTQGG